MAGLLQSLMGMAEMTEQVIATDFLLAAKTGVRNYAMAITESVTPEVREVLQRQLDAAIETHEKIVGYMIDRGYYHVNDPAEQMKVDMKAADTVLHIPK